MAVWKSVEYVEVSITAATEPVIVNLTKSQDESQCTPFYTQRTTDTTADQHQDRIALVEFIDNSGTSAVRVTASGMSEVSPVVFQIFVVEWDSSIVVQQVTVSGLTEGTALVNQAITDVGDQTTAFFTYSYQYTNVPTSDDDANDAMVRLQWNGSSTSSVELSRGTSGGDVNGVLYVVECNDTEFVVEQVTVTMSGGLESATASINTVVLADTFLVHSALHNGSTDDMDEWAFQADLQDTTTVRVRRALTNNSDISGNCRIQVVECQNNEWDVQREAALTLASATQTDTITAVDLTRSLVQMMHPVGLTSVPRNDSTQGNIIDDVLTAVDLSADDTVRFRMRLASITDGIASYEVIQFAASVSNDITAALSTSLSLAADLDATGQLAAAQTLALSVAADMAAQGKIEAAASLILTVASDLKGAGEIQAANALQISVLADLDALGALSAAASLALSVAADLDAQGKLEASASVAFTIAANITQAAGSDLAASLSTVFAATPNLNAVGTLAATLSNVLTATPNLNAVGALAAAPALTLSAASDLKAQGKLEAANALLLQLAADLNAMGQLSASAILALTTAANLTALGKIESALAISMTVTAAVTAAANNDIAANPSISLMASPNIDASGKLEASPGLSTTTLADLRGGGALHAAPPLSISAIADLDARGQVAAVLPVALAVAADVSAAGELVAAAQLIISVVAGLTAADPPTVHAAVRILVDARNTRGDAKKDSRRAESTKRTTRVDAKPLN